MPTPRLRHLIAAATAAAVVLTPTLAAATSPDASPGSAGIGDPYFPDYGNGGYDVRHYDVAVDVSGSKLSGTTTLRATATQALSRFNLDFVLHTTKVTVNGDNATFSHTNVHELVVTPSAPIPSGGDMVVVVSYSDEPGSVFDHGINPVSTTSPGTLILGEPEAAPWWIASNDHPRDKATYDIAITAPTGLEAVSAGRLVGHESVTGVDGASKDTWHWRVAQRTTGYLVFLAVGEYDLTEDTIDGLPVVTAIGQGTGAAGQRAKADFDRMDEVLAFLRGQFGSYRFNAIGNVVPNTSLGFALETQTRPVYSPGFWSDDRNIGVVVHEWAHQWWGDNVSVHNWRNIWMNEGFATWATWRWQEAHGGDSANAILHAYYDFFGPNDTFWDLHIGDPGANQLFAGEVYDRGAMTVQALRNRIGDANIREVFRRWNSRHHLDDASTRQFRALAEQVSGEHLGGFFRAWLSTSAKPANTPANGMPGGAVGSAPVTADDVPSFAALRASTEAIATAEGRG